VCPQSSTDGPARQGGGHTHLCRNPECNRAFDCDGDDCEQFHFSTCPDCRRPKVEPDAPPAERDPEEVGGVN
jgi:hypothetical protein